MKKVLLTGLVVLLTSPLMAQTNQNVLPQNSRDFLSKHFPDAKIVKAEKEDSWFNWDKNEMYEIHLSNDLKLDFNKNGEVTEIDSDGTAPIPADALPTDITSYVKSNFSGQEIASWELGNNGQEIELTDGTELEFDENGKYLKQD